MLLSDIATRVQDIEGLPQKGDVVRGCTLDGNKLRIVFEGCYLDCILPEVNPNEFDCKDN